MMQRRWRRWAVLPLLWALVTLACGVAGNPPIPGSTVPPASKATAPVVAGTWSDTSSLNIARAGYVMNTLLDGRVLVAGGLGGGASTEIYNPLTRTWSLGKDMNVARTRFASVTLLDGRVLVAGGRDGSTSLASAEVYDPATGTWSVTGSMTTPRDWLSMVRLADGRVLAAGGLDLTRLPADAALQSAEIYTPATGTWVATSDMSTKRWGFALVALPDGRVLAAGGANANSECQFSPTSEVFAPATGTWTPTGDMHVHRGFGRAILAGGRVLFLGGEIAAAGALCAVTTASVEAFDPATGTFSTLGPLLDDGALQAVASLPDGRILVAGGTRYTSAGHAALSSSEIYDPTTGLATRAAPLSTARASILGSALPDGSVLVPGGTQPHAVAVPASATFSA
jgi:hypothetical protein